MANREDHDGQPAALPADAAAERDVGVVEARRRFGGIDIPASLSGMLVALAMTIILAGVLSAIIGSIGYEYGFEQNREELGLGGLIGGVVALLLAFLVGGWAAGRMARYDGGLNGLMTAVWFVVLGALLAVLGAWAGTEYNVFDRVDLPRWFTSDEATAAGIISAIVALLAMFVGGWLGGTWGERLHRRADATIVTNRPGGIATRPDVADK